MFIKITLRFLFLLYGFSSILYAQDFKDKLETIDTFLTLEYPKDEPGAAVLIAKNDEIIFERAYGLSSLTPKKKMKTDMVFQIGSMSKQFVSAAVLQLIENGMMRLHEPIQTYVPYYPEKKFPITIHHLLSQTSGIPEYFDVDEDEYELLAREYTPKNLIDFYKNKPLLFKPGDQYHYSNSNYPLLGLAIENVTGLSLKDYLETKLFDPLNMPSTGLWYRTNTKSKQIVNGYAENNGGFQKGPEISATALYAPGGIVSNVKDQWTWYKALNNTTVLSSSIIEQLITEKFTSSGQGTSYGYGFAIKNIQGSATYQHSGILFGYTSTAVYIPDQDIFVCILSNTKFDRTEELSSYLFSVIMGNPIEIYSKTEITRDLLDAYTGTYTLINNDLERTFKLIIFDNQLIFHDPTAPQNDAILTPSGKDNFVLKTANAYFEFIRSQRDTIVETLKVTQGDEHYIFKRHVKN